MSPITAVSSILQINPARPEGWGGTASYSVRLPPLLLLLVLLLLLSAVVVVIAAAVAT